VDAGCDATLHRWTLRFRDGALERAYREVSDARGLRAARVTSLGGLVLTAVPALLLLAFAPDDWLPRKTEVAIGAVIVSATFLVAWVGTFTGWAARHPHPLNAAYTCLLAAFLATLMRYFPPEFVTHRGFLFIAVEIFGTYGLLQLRLLPGVVGGSLAVVAYGAVMQASGLLTQLDLARHLFWLTICNLWGILVCYQLDLASRREFVARQEVEALLHNILPRSIAARLKSSRERIAEHAEQVTVLFADIVGFTPLSAGKRPDELVALLDRVFTEFDGLATRHGLEKIKTVGDAYMAVAGLPQSQPDHAVRGARMALAMIERVRAVAGETGEPLQLRVGLHSGPVVAGVIGRSKFSYDLWGDTVNTASRMESSGLPGAVQCTPATAALLGGEFAPRPRGAIEVKGKGTMETYLL
jgi:adenylate cyclase